ncbi:MAG: hypothetical protein GSR86_07020 [Desulfurococcales archaeon]|nr:hypothetical protein [Desulfurococcales archaeon]
MEHCREKAIEALGNSGLARVCGDARMLECMEWGDSIIIKASACGKSAYLIKVGRGVGALIRDLVSGRMPGVRGCMEQASLDIIGFGVRSVIATLNGKLVKVNLVSVEDNLEDKVLRYLDRRAPEISPGYVCSIRYDNILAGIITRRMGERPLAVDYIEYARKALSGSVEEPSLNKMLGRSIALLHNTLYQCREEWCKPSNATATHVESWINRVKARARIIKGMAEGQDRLQMLEAADALEEMAGWMYEYTNTIIGDVIMRIHGDLHLYQAYIDGDSIYFTDFEGEPYREPARRDELEPPIRDIASIARSIWYATALAGMDSGMSAEDASIEAVEKLAGWRSNVINNMIDEYRSSVYKELWPRGWEGKMLFWLVERASYELVYEVIESTGLHHIPLNAILKLRDSWPRIYW